MSDQQQATLEIPEHAPPPLPAPAESPAPRRVKKRWIMVVILFLAAAVGIYYGVRELIFTLNHESTDDAAVNSHVTFIAPRVTGVAVQVCVEDNQRVNTGDLLVRLDPEPFKIVVQEKAAALARAKLMAAQRFAALDVAQADLDVARTAARAQIAGLRADWFLVATVQDFVRYEMASLDSAAATLHQKEANLKLAQENFDRIKQLSPQSISQEQLDERTAELTEAREDVAVATESIQQTRALLGLAANRDDPVAAPSFSDIVNHFNGAQYTVSSAEQALAQLGITIDAPKSLDDFKQRLLSLSQDQVVDHSPAVLAAAARLREAQATVLGKNVDQQPDVMAAQNELDQANLDLTYTEIRSPIDGYVTSRNINNGAHVTEGQSLLAVRALDKEDVWVDANFKETQLSDLRIGQSVELHVDAYPDHVFHGRVAGFSPGTGAIMSLLPPENATGNYVKVVQRLPVRILITDPDPAMPLFAGLSVVPDVDIKSDPTGPDAGKRLLTERATKPSLATDPASPVAGAGQ